MKVLKVIHTLYGVIVFWMLFFLFFPLLLIPVISKKHFRLVGVFNRWWGRLLFFLIGIPVETRYESELNPNVQYIFCPNHFSYLDIAVMGLNRHNTIFVGKNDMEKIPLFGFMYRKLHITVDRQKLRSLYSTLVRTLTALGEGKSLVIFPEGGFVTTHKPVLGKFKDGAFRASIEKQIPIVPVTIPYNWIILPADELLLRWKPAKVIFHAPVDPAGYTLKEIDQYKEKVRKIISDELERHLRNEDRS